MKVIAVFAIFLIAGTNALTLPEAMVQLRQVLGLQNWVSAWTVRRNADNAVCAYSNRLNQPNVMPQAVADINNDVFYRRLEDMMDAQNVPWQNFMDQELLPALGLHALVPTCTTLSSGGVAALHSQIRGYFNKELVLQTVTRLRAESADFNHIMQVISDGQSEVKRIRCIASVQRVFNVKSEAGVDFPYVFEILEAIFGWSPITPGC